MFKLLRVINYWDYNLSHHLLYVFIDCLLINVLCFSLGILYSEKNNISKNPIHLDHCYYKDYPPNTPEYTKTNTSFKHVLSTGIHHIKSKL